MPIMNAKNVWMDVKPAQLINLIALSVLLILIEAMIEIHANVLKDFPLILLLVFVKLKIVLLNVDLVNLILLLNV